MRLINVHSLEFKEFIDPDKRPAYAILSHRWGENELTYKDWLKRRNLQGPGYRKIVSFCALIRNAAIQWHCFNVNHMSGSEPWSSCCNFSACAIKWVWIDTCCIDKKSSAELSESINSMYIWYEQAAMCFVHLAEYQDGPKGTITERLEQCDWFYRGWTLQELLAPDCLCFCDANWKPFGYIMAKECLKEKLSDCYLDTNKQSMIDLVQPVSGITNIPTICLLTQSTHVPWEEFGVCVANKMSWAARRKTTRVEDKAYCLLGLFGVNMPLIYGEGPRAFQRLQEEIIKQSDDRTILASRSVRLAHDPSDFQHTRDMQKWLAYPATSAYALTNLGVEMKEDLLVIPKSQMLVLPSAFYGIHIYFMEGVDEVYLLPVGTMGPVDLRCFNRTIDHHGAHLLAVFMTDSKTSSMYSATDKDLQSLSAESSLEVGIFLALEEHSLGQPRAGRSQRRNSFRKVGFIGICTDVDIDTAFKWRKMKEPWYKSN